MAKGVTVKPGVAGGDSSSPAPGAKAKETYYKSKYHNLTVHLKTAYVSTDVSGKRVLHPGLKVDFVGGAYATSDPEIIKGLDEKAGLDFEKVGTPSGGLSKRVMNGPKSESKS